MWASEGALGKEPKTRQRGGDVVSLHWLLQPSCVEAAKQRSAKLQLLDVEA